MVGAYEDCCIDRVTALGGGSVMLWGGISITGITGVAILEGHLNVVRYQDEILQPAVITYLHNQCPNSIFQDDTAPSHIAKVITDSLQNMGVQRMEWPAKSPDLTQLST